MFGLLCFSIDSISRVDAHTIYRSQSTQLYTIGTQYCFGTDSKTILDLQIYLFKYIFFRIICCLYYFVFIIYRLYTRINWIHFFVVFFFCIKTEAFKVQLAAKGNYVSVLNKQIS